MKVKGLFTILVVLVCMGAFAQPASGYYRIRSHTAKKYIGILNDKINYYTIIAGAGGGGSYLSGLSGDATKSRACAMSAAKQYLQTDIQLIDDEELTEPSTIFR